MTDMRNLLKCLVAILLFTAFYSCQKELSVEFGTPASGTLQSSAGDCLPKNVAGSYIANRAMNDSNFIEVTVNVLTPGSYIIYSDSVNGYAFKATGAFTTTGNNTVRLKGSGRPVNPGVNNFTVVFDSSFCSVSITVLPSGTGAAAYTMTCPSFTPSGNFIKDTTLDTRHRVTAQVNVTAIGTYSITTNTVNGYSFAASGTFSSTGAQSVVLQGTGKPLAAGTDNFIATGAGLTCNFPITVSAGGATSCGTAEGTYTTGTALTATNKITVTHNYAAAGTYPVSVNTVNGYTFTTAPVTVTAAGNVNITLNGSGTPLAAGTNTFTINFADGTTCTFTATVGAAVNNDYFPTTANSYWTYSDGTGPTDTFKVTNAGPTQVFNGNTYQRFVYSDGLSGERFFRKNASAFYYESLDTAGYGPTLVFTTSRLDLLFLKNTLATGDSLVSDFPAVYTSATLTLTGSFRVKYKVVNANATITVNGKTFTNAYQLVDSYQFVTATALYNFTGLTPVNSYYVRGVGLVKDDATTDWDIRYWQVN